MINIKIVQAQAEIEKHFLVLQFQFNHVTPVMLKNAYLGLPLSHSKAKSEKAARPSQTLLEAFDEFITVFEKKAKKGIRQEGTLRHWRSTKRKVEAFIRFRYQRKDIEMTEIDQCFAEEFYDYLTLHLDESLSEVATPAAIVLHLTPLEMTLLDIFLSDLLVHRQQLLPNRKQRFYHPHLRHPAQRRSPSRCSQQRAYRVLLK